MSNTSFRGVVKFGECFGDKPKSIGSLRNRSIDLRSHTKQKMRKLKQKDDESERLKKGKPDQRRSNTNYCKSRKNKTSKNEMMWRLITRVKISAFEMTVPGPCQVRNKDYVHKEIREWVEAEIIISHVSASAHNFNFGVFYIMHDTLWILSG